MPLNILSSIQTLHLTSVFKIGVLIVIGGYLIFLFIIYRQVQLMNNVITQTVSGKLLEFFALLLVFAVLALFLVSVAIL